MKNIQAHHYDRRGTELLKLWRQFDKVGDRTSALAVWRQYERYKNGLSTWPPEPQPAIRPMRIIDPLKMGK